MNKAGGVLLLGASGFIGQHLTSALANEVRYSKKYSKLTVLSRSGTECVPPGVDVIRADISDSVKLREALKECVLVVNLVSSTTPGDTAGCPQQEMEANLKPNLCLLETLQEFEQIKLVYVSTGGAIYGDSVAGLIPESSSLNPNSYYGATKAAIEAYISAFVSQCNRSAVVLRPSNIYGPGQVLRAGFGIVPTIFNCLDTEDPITIWGDGKAMRDYLFIDDFIELFLKVVVNMPDRGMHVYNVGSGNAVSIHQLIDVVERITGLRLNRKYQRKRSVDVKAVILDSTLAESTFRWSARTTIEDGLFKTWEWWNSNGVEIRKVS